MKRKVMKRENYAKYSPTILRFAVGGFFITAGILKLLSVGDLVSFIGQKLPAPYFLAWLWLLIEIIFGAAVLVGWNLKYTIWPPIAILAILLIFIYLPDYKDAIFTIWFYLLAIAALVSLRLTDAGAWAIN